MKLAKYWARSDRKKDGIIVRGWSNNSLQDALENASQRARKILNILKSDSTQSMNRYWYGDHPLPEPVEKELITNSEGPKAVITRNHYGALVLNTEELFIADIDIPQKTTAPLVSFFLKLLGKKTPTAPSVEDISAQIMATLSRQSFRLYRTKAGLRVIITDHKISSDSAEAIQLFEKLGSDLLYRKLCKAQECYRARLTPKPWRCDILDKPPSYPYATAQLSDSADRWIKHYESKITNYSTCQLLQDVRPQYCLPDFKALLETHDKISKVEVALPLA